jgi:hypothetical protein
MRLPAFAARVAVLLSFAMNSPSLFAGSDVDWRRAAYWDARYPTCWTSGTAIRDVLEYAGYAILDADQLQAWMTARISDGAPSVVVFCQDIVPDTVAERMLSSCTLRAYLDAGGKVVWYADIPIYYQGHSDGSRTTWGVEGAMSVLGCSAAEAPWDSGRDVTFTEDGRAWGLTVPWQSTRPTRDGSLDVLARDPSGYAAAWVRHYLPADHYRGFVRLFDQAGVPDVQDVRRAAEYPNVPADLDLDNDAERRDDIVAAFFYPWYENPNTSSRWRHWEGDGKQPPRTWTSRYLPDYPDSTWNPAVQLYDSRNVQVLRWQDRAMARAGIDIAISSWWGIGSAEDLALAKAIRTCKSVQWCIYYEAEAYGDPSAQKIFQDIKSVIDRYGPTRNYAKVDNKWLVFVYGAHGNETAARWRDAKARLAGQGYLVYLNADTGDAGPANAPDPWDAVHRYMPVIYHGSTRALPDVDDSAWVSPGFWGVTEATAALPRSLSAFSSGWEEATSSREHHRFMLIETWNEWHEGTQIEPGQAIDPNPTGYKPGGYDYGYDYIDEIAPAAREQPLWVAAGACPVVPVVLRADALIWEPSVVAEKNSECRIPAENVRIGRQIFVPASGTLTLTVRAKASSPNQPQQPEWPEALVYVDHEIVARLKVSSSSSSLVLKKTAEAQRGVHTVEIGMDILDGRAWSLIVTSLEVQLTARKDDNGDLPPSTKPALEGFEGGNFGTLPWGHAGADSWTVTSTEHKSGAYSAKAGAIGDSESTSLTVTLVCVQGEIRFYRKVSCESDWDYLEFDIDGERKGRWSGELDWEQASFPVAAGTHTFTWTYCKDSASSEGEDTAWIDDIAFPLP